ncbi:MAG TPA: tRNA (guanosine(46)-N7)-methyltransferase TrmB [Candidatus Cloacimonadota bacterium]|nr:tRNA (guanosine(46)-N7)-methyltransferase TrmB [Candidatus Cloacimonadota bacterium]HPK41014.1 tRNA (guanosine(46)-N7)-methyltransferase TrmB [Candidatus Cloacimonadota bacterium]
MEINEKIEYFVIEKKDNEVLNFEKIFNNNNPIHIEIGSGKGELLQLQSFFHKNINYIGVEVKSKRIMNTVKKLDIKINKNVRLLNLFIDENINKWVKPQTISEIIIFHPDPWPKRKHHSRRLIQHDFINSLSYLLKDNGFLKLSTDHTDYANWIIKHFQERDDFEPIFENDSQYIFPEDHFTTYFDELKESEGFPPQFLYYRKIKSLSERKVANV